MTTTPVRLDRMQAGIVAWLATAFPAATVLWSPSEWPGRAAGTLVLTAKVIAGPDSTPLGGECQPTAILPMTATARVLPAALAAVGEDVALRASGRTFEYRIGAGDSAIENIRDGWLAAILADPPGPCVDATFEAVDDDEIAIAALEAGDLWDLGVLGTGLAELDVETDVVVETQIGELEAVIEIQAWATSRYPRGGALAALASLLSRRGLSTARGALDAWGLGINPGRVIPLDGMTGPAYASRATVSVRVTMLSFAVEAPLVIEHVRGTLIARADPELEIAIDTEPPT